MELIFILGGKHLQAAIDNMNIFGRIVLCGTTSQYNNNLVAHNNNTYTSLAPSSSSGVSNLFLAVSNRLRLQGFIWSDHKDILTEFNSYMSKWINDGRIKWKENIYEVLENAPKAFVGLFKGKAFGRRL